MFLLSLALNIAPLVLKRKGPWLLDLTAMRGAGHLGGYFAVWPDNQDKGFAISIALAILLVMTANRHSVGPPDSCELSSTPGLLRLQKSPCRNGFGQLSGARSPVYDRIQTRERPHRFEVTSRSINTSVLTDGH